MEGTDNGIYGFEKKVGDDYFYQHLMADDFNYQDYRKPIDYFKKYGFDIPEMYSVYYSQINGIKSDKYLSMDLYYYYILPYLNKYEFKEAYADKNMYSVLFPEAKQPETIVKNINGHFYDADRKELSFDAVIKLLWNIKDCIVKPTIESFNGDNVIKISTTDGLISNNNGEGVSIQQLLDTYNANYIFQKCVTQHPVMASFNKTSVNTLRIYTYRVNHDSEYVVLFTAIRFGGKGAIKDNVSAGGRSCHVNNDGIIGDTIFRYKSLYTGSRSEENIGSEKIPIYNEVIDCALSLHRLLPYFDLIGWDFAIDKDSNPVMIEFNLSPAIEFAEIVNGPLLANYLDDILSKASARASRLVVHMKNIFPGKPGFWYSHKEI